MSGKHLFIDHNGDMWCWWIGEKRDGPKSYFWSTNVHGQGIWYYDLSDGEVTQIVGTCDFSVRGVKDPRSKIRRWVSK